MEAIIQAWVDKSKVRTGNQIEHILCFQSVNGGFQNFVQGKTTFRGQDVRMQLPFCGHLQHAHTHTPHTSDCVNN